MLTQNSQVEEGNWTHKLTHQAARSKVGVKKRDNIVLRQNQAYAKNDSRGGGADMASECVETCCGHNEPTDDYNHREKIYAKHHTDLLCIAIEE